MRLYLRPCLLLAPPLLVACSGGGKADDDCPDGGTPTQLWPDADGDGYTTAVPETLCVGDTVPDGYSAAATETDCDDASAAAFPGAPDIMDDGIDQDCDGADATGSTGTESYVDASSASCQDDTVGTPSAPNCTISAAGVFVEPGGTVYVASGDGYLDETGVVAGRTYLGSRDPSTWEAGSGGRTVVTSTVGSLAPALALSGDGGGLSTYVEGIDVVPDGQGVFATMFNASGTTVLVDVNVIGPPPGGTSAIVMSGDLEWRDSRIDLGDCDGCEGVYAVQGSLTATRMNITGGDGATLARGLRLQAGRVVLDEVTIDVGVGAERAIGITVGEPVSPDPISAYISGTSVRTGGTEYSRGIEVRIPGVRLEIENSAFSGSSDGASDTSAAFVEEASTVIAANCVFDGGIGLGTLAYAVYADEGSLTLVNSLLVGGVVSEGQSVPLHVEPGVDLTVVSNNFWGPSVGVLVDGAAEITSVGDLNACGWADCREAGGNTAVDPLFEDASGGSFVLQAASPLVDAGIDPTPYGIIVERDLAGNPVPADGDDDGTPWWDVGAYER